MDSIVKLKMGVTGVFFSFQCRVKLAGVSGSVVCGGSASKVVSRRGNVFVGQRHGILDFSLKIVFWDEGLPLDECRGTAFVSFSFLGAPLSSALSTTSSLAAQRGRDRVSFFHGLAGCFPLGGFLVFWGCLAL